MSTKKRIISICMCLVMAITLLIPQPVQAKEAPIYNKEYNDVFNNIYSSIQLLEDLLQKSYKKNESDLKEEITKKDYNYALSMESIKAKGNPFRNVDYIKLLAAYCTIKGNQTDVTICDVNFFSKKEKEKIGTYNVPYKVPIYEKVTGRIYEKNGYKYLTEPCSIATYKPLGNGKYEKTNSIKKYIPQKEETRYLEATLRVIEPADLFLQFGMNIKAHKTEYESRIKKMTEEKDVSVEGLSQSVFVQISEGCKILDSTASSQLERVMQTASGNTRDLIQTAASLIGRVPYEWGGKSSKSGYDNSWWTYNSEGEQKGLDCSGFVQWSFRSAGYEPAIWKQLTSTGEILRNCKAIKETDLKIGDMGLLNNGSSVNHVGIYIGGGYFIHCSSSAETVTVSQFPFTLFRRVENIESARINPITEEASSTMAISYKESDVQLLAQTISHEAKGEGLNGWIGVAEVIVNRVKSSLFPDSVYDVIYAKNQFSYNEEIKDEKPTDAMLQVAKDVMNGTLRIFNNRNVLFFRNPGSNSNNSDWGNYPYYMRINHHVFYTLKN